MSSDFPAAIAKPIYPNDIHASPWWEIVTSLPYPAVLGTVMYSLLELGSKWTRQDSSVTYAYQTLGAPKWASITIVALSTFAICWHFSADFLYTKHMAGNYRLTHFLVDILICAALAAGFSAFTARVSGSPESILEGYEWLLGSLLIIYAGFIVWDLHDYFLGFGGESARSGFSKSMLRGELVAILLITPLMVLNRLAAEHKTSAWLSIIASVALIFGLSFWLWRKTSQLRRNDHLTMRGSALPLCPGFTLSQAEPDDIPAAAELMSSTYREVYGEPWTRDAASRRLTEILHADPFFCFVVSDRFGLAAIAFSRRFAWYSGTRLWVEELVVRSDVRGAGVGTAILNFILARGSRAALSGYDLNAHDESRAALLYSRFGFLRSDWSHLEALGTPTSTQPADELHPPLGATPADSARRQQTSGTSYTAETSSSGER